MTLLLHCLGQDGRSPCEQTARLLCISAAAKPHPAQITKMRLLAWQPNVQWAFDARDRGICFAKLQGVHFRLCGIRVM